MRAGRVFPASGAARGALALCAGALLVLPGCGGGSNNSGTPIPSQQANQMIALLAQADRQSSQGTCNGADAKVRQAQAVLDTLPNSVDKDVRQTLADGLEHTRALIGSECKRPQQTQTTTTPTTTTPTETTTTPTTTTPTTTTPTTTTPTTTTGNGGTPPPPSG